MPWCNGDMEEHRAMKDRLARAEARAAKLEEALREAADEVEAFWEATRYGDGPWSTEGRLASWRALLAPEPSADEGKEKP